MIDGSRLQRLGFRRSIGVVLFIYWAGLFIGTHVPLPEGALPGQSDKLAHFGAYAGLALLLALWLATGGNFAARHYVGVFLAVAVYAAADELLQIPVGRNADLYDWLADCAGALIGLSLLWLLRSFWTRRRRT